jgi:DNA-3-methyladenine glycosylase I
VAIIRCPWARSDLDMQNYHDNEWGVPLFDDQKLFEFLVLEGAQAGLSWLTILKRRDNYRQVFADFDPKEVATFGDEKLSAILQNPGIIRNRLKIESVRLNAKAFLEVAQNCGSFADYLWSFVDGKPVANHFSALSEVPATSPLSDQLSMDLKQKGFKFVGPTICYAFMQAVGMVNDHLTDCFRYQQLTECS